MMLFYLIASILAASAAFAARNERQIAAAGAAFYAVQAVFALCIRKELLLPLLCGVFLVESFSVMLQVGWFKYTKRKYGEGRRILLMSPIHHHYQKRGIFETKIVIRFWIISLLLAAMTLVTLKIR